MEINAVIRGYIVENFLAGQADGFDDATPLVTGGIVDSVGMVALVNFVENEFGIEFLPREVDAYSLDTVALIAEAVGRKRSGTGV